MTRAIRPIIAATLGFTALTACTDPASVDGTDPNRQTKQGALLGGAVGAAVGIITGDDPKERRQNAIKGAIIGGGAGAIIGNQLDKQEADLRRDLNNNDVSITNTGDRLIVSMPNNILFATDSDTLRSDLQRDLRTVASNLQAYPNSTIQVIGHTDNEGDAGYNQGLSERRAQSVAGILISSGVSSGRIQTYGRGEDQPIASNLTPEGRAQNRRVEIVILPNA